VTAEARCRCCGVPVEGNRATFRVCIGCDRCDGLHGQVLEGVLRKAVADRKLDPGVALARAIMDDAQLTCRTEYVPRETGGADIVIMNPPERWRVVIARALCRNELPDLASVVDAVLRRWLPAPYSSALGERIAADLLPALRVIDSSIFGVDIDCHRDIADPEHLIIKVNASTPTLGAALVDTRDVAIPDYVMRTPRGSA
jgi:hypothetical protein